MASEDEGTVGVDGTIEWRETKDGRTKRMARPEGARRAQRPPAFAGQSQIGLSVP